MKYHYMYPGLKTLSRGNVPTLGSMKLNPLLLRDKHLAIKYQMGIWSEINTFLSSSVIYSESSFLFPRKIRLGQQIGIQPHVYE